MIAKRKAEGDQVIGTVVQAVEAGIRGGSIRADARDPMTFAITLWAFTHRIVQLTVANGANLARRGIAIPSAPFIATGLVIFDRIRQKQW